MHNKHLAIYGGSKHEIPDILLVLKKSSILKSNIVRHWAVSTALG